MISKFAARIYDQCNFQITDFVKHNESQEYDGCEFLLNNKKIIYRTSKITPKKVGQFVTFWKRNKNGITEPFSEIETLNYYVINVQRDNKKGQFIFPKSILIEKGILSTLKKEGKRGFRVYPIWDKTMSKQAIVTQNWQLNYFFEINENLDLEIVKKLYQFYFYNL